jgi:cyclophilin family peptidyl-prolyl cis-trans isomerase
MGFYNGLTFTAWCQFRDQGGDPTGTVAADPPIHRVEDSPLNNVRGSVAMARSAGRTPPTLTSSSISKTTRTSTAVSEKKYVVLPLSPEWTSSTRSR